MQAVAVFVAVARHNNFTRAAAELNTTQSAVSYQVKVLERFAGTALFERQARGVVLTMAGMRIFPILQQSLQDVRGAFRSLKEESDRLLVITTMQTIANAWLAPRLGALQMQHPDLAVRLSTSDDVVDLTTGAADVAIRSGKGEWPGVTAHHWLDQTFTPVASPLYLAREGRPATPADLLDHVLIAPTDDWWGKWFDAAGVNGPHAILRPGVDVDTQHTAVRLALSGQGVALATPAFIRPEIEQGQLVRLFDIDGGSGTSYYIAYAKSRAASRKIRLFRDWALKMIKDGR